MGTPSWEWLQEAEEMEWRIARALSSFFKLTKSMHLPWSLPWKQVRLLSGRFYSVSSADAADAPSFFGQNISGKPFLAKHCLAN